MPKPVAADIEEIDWDDGQRRQAVKVTVNDEAQASTHLSVAEAKKLQHRLERLTEKIEGVKKLARPTNGLAITSLVLGVAGFVTLGITGFAGAPLGHIALRRSSSLDGAGRVMSIIGIAISYLFIGFWLLFWSAMIITSVTR